MDLTERRRFFAEEIQATANIRNTAVVEALAAVPRERFLGPGPWTIRGESDFQQAPRQTDDADPRHVYHNFAVAIDTERQLFNGAPGVIAMAIDCLMLKPGDRVLHVGCGTGYYTALMAACVGPTGRVVAVEIDDELASRARVNLLSTSGVDVRNGDGSGQFGMPFDAILVNAGATHPLTGWMDALAPDGRMILPLTCAMTPTIGKGLLLLLAGSDDPAGLTANIVGFVAIYSALGIRDEGINTQIGQALRANPFPFVKRWRFDAHDSGPSCWLHTTHGCLSTG
jgi:protein-L-isoaspartate(D-aspartate) O-methyltransferase